MAGPGDLYLMLDSLLDAGIEALDTVPDALGSAFEGAPERSFVSPGTPEVDCCPMMAVWSPSLGEGARSPQQQQETFRINVPQLNLMVVRCVPVGELKEGTYYPPTRTELDAAAQQVLADGWALWNHIWNLIEDGQLFEQCELGFWDGEINQAPAGGCSGWTLTLRQQLNGYREVFST